MSFKVVLKPAFYNKRIIHFHDIIKRFWASDIGTWQIAFRTRKMLLELIERVLKPMAISKIADNGSPAISPQILTGFGIYDIPLRVELKPAK